MLQHYKNGVFVDGDCTASEFHAMLVVGYEPEYWIIKNRFVKSGNKPVKHYMSHDMTKSTK